MSAEDYFRIALPTAEDFAEWTRDHFARWDELHARLRIKYPELYRARNIENDMFNHTKED